MTSAAKSSLVAKDQHQVLRFGRHLIELRRCLYGNADGLINYSHAYRAEERISTAPAESTMHYLGNDRMAKKRPTRLSAEGTHLMLEVRCAALADQLGGFREWYPEFRRNPTATPIRGPRHYPHLGPGCS